MASLTKSSLALAQAPVIDSKPPRTRDRNKRAPRPPTPVDIIVLSSDDDEVPVAPVRKQKRKRTAHKDGKANGNDAAGTGTAVYTVAREGLAPWDSLTDAESSEMARLRKENEALKRERDSYRTARDKAEASKNEAETKVVELSNSLKRKATYSQTDLSDLEESVSCEICTMKMWNPATLTGCGHTFCEKCLHDWFNATYTRHVQAHPAFLAGPQIPEQYLRHLIDPRVAGMVADIRADFLRRVPQPVYTCPTCRVAVRKRPIDVYALKAVVRKVARLMGDGEASPRRMVNRAVGSMWAGFFP